MELITRRKTTVKEHRQMEDMLSTVERNQATLEYVAAMADVELPDDETSEEMPGEETEEE